MNLTTEQKKHVASVYYAASYDDPVQFQDSFGSWGECDPFKVSHTVSPEEMPDRWRIAPKKVVRKWTPNDVPGLCWLMKSDRSSDAFLVVAVNDGGVDIMCEEGFTESHHENELTFKDLFNEWSWSDRPAGAFKPCTVEDQQ